MTGKLLTPGDATARLPFVQAVAADVSDRTARLRAAVSAYDREKARPLPSQIALNEGRADIHRLRAELVVCAAELASADALPDAAGTYVDFVSSRGGSEIRLCWRAGEPRVEHWHGADEPHAARRPVDVPVHAG